MSEEKNLLTTIPRSATERIEVAIRRQSVGVSPSFESERTSDRAEKSLGQNQRTRPTFKSAYARFASDGRKL